MRGEERGKTGRGRAGWLGGKGANRVGGGGGLTPESPGAKVE